MPIRADVSNAPSSYVVGPILRACALMQSFRHEGECVPLRDLVARTGLNKTTVFRAAETLVAGGLLERTPDNRYRAVFVHSRRKTFRVGYATITGKSLFGRDVSESIRLAAADAEIELTEMDNQLSPRIAMANAERLIKQKVDLVIEFQACHRIAPAIAARFAAAAIPMIAVHTPHPGATFFGGDNYLAGRLGGAALAAWATHAWDGRADQLLLLGHAGAGPLTNSRLTGMATAIAHGLPRLPASASLHLDCKGGYTETVDLMLRHLTRSKARRFLVGAINDSVALGALRAFAEMGRSEDCAVMGQNGTLAARAELRRPGSRLVGSVAFYPERYGDYLLPLAMGILTRQSNPRAVFTKHALITARNVEETYPNDALLSAPDGDLLLMGHYH